MSLRKAINLKCKDCIYDPKAKGAWLMQVSACIDEDCPLWVVRPLTKKSNIKEDSENGTKEDDCTTEDC